MSRYEPQAQKDVGNITRGINPPLSTRVPLSQRVSNWHNVNDGIEKTRQGINTSITHAVRRADRGVNVRLTRHVLDRYDESISARNVAKLNRSTYRSGRNARQRARGVCRPPYRLRRGIVTSPYTTKYGIAYVRYSVSETYIIPKYDVAMWRCSTRPRHRPCTWAPAVDADEMSVTDSSPPTNTALALTAPAPTHRESVSSGDVGGPTRTMEMEMEMEMEADGGADDESMGHDPEAVLSQLTEINDGFIQIGYANHAVVLEAIAILNETDVRPVKTGTIRTVANRISTETEFSRPNIENSLKVLYSEDDDHRFIDRSGPDGNAYDWFVTERGRDVLGLLYEAGIIEALAEGDVTADIE